MRYCDCAAGVLLLQVIFGKFTSRNCPQCFGTGPSDQGGTRHGGSAAWISRTSVFVGSDLENPCELQLVIRARLAGGIREQSNAGGIRWLVEQHHFIASQDGGGFQRGWASHVDIASFRGPTRQVVAACRYRGATRQVVRCSYSVGDVFFPFRFTVLVTAHTLTHLRPGPSGVTGLMGSLLDLMWRNWGC
jgi:hypothetical protein